MNRFWNWIRDEDGERVLRLEGPIDSDGFWGDEVTPQDFRNELEAGDGDVTVWINSEGGNVFAAAEIYTMLKDYKGKVTVKIASVAASAASVVAMAGDEVLMSPTAMLFLHDPSTIAIGNARDMEKAIDTLNAVKDSIINAYRAKTGLSRARLSKIMEEESWIHAEEAVKLGFADGILFEGKAGDKAEPKPDDPDKDPDDDNPDTDDPGKDGEDSVKDAADKAVIFSTKAMGRIIMNRLTSMAVSDKAQGKDPDAKEKEGVKPDAEVVAVDVDHPDEAVSVDKAEAEAESIPTDRAEADGEPETVPDSSPATPSDGAADMEEPPADAEPPDTPKPTDAEPPGAEGKEPEMPIIGMDGRTKEGAMPYDLLKKQLDFLR